MFAAISLTYINLVLLTLAVVACRFCFWVGLRFRYHKAHLRLFEFDQSSSMKAVAFLSLCTETLLATAERDGWIMEPKAWDFKAANWFYGALQKRLNKNDHPADGRPADIFAFAALLKAQIDSITEEMAQEVPAPVEPVSKKAATPLVAAPTQDSVTTAAVDYPTVAYEKPVIPVSDFLSGAPIRPRPHDREEFRKDLKVVRSRSLPSLDETATIAAGDEAAELYMPKSTSTSSIGSNGSNGVSPAFNVFDHYFERYNFQSMTGSIL